MISRIPLPPTPWMNSYQLLSTGVCFFPSFIFRSSVVCYSQKLPCLVVKIFLQFISHIQVLIIEVMILARLSFVLFDTISIESTYQFQFKYLYLRMWSTFFILQSQWITPFMKVNILIQILCSISSLISFIVNY